MHPHFSTTISLFIWTFSYFQRFYAWEYVVVVDLGSTGSRSYVYHRKGDEQLMEHPGTKVTPGFSSLNGSSEEMLNYMWPLFQTVITLIPTHFHSSTRCFIKATAGMRLLSSDQQLFMFDQLHRALASNSLFPFLLNRADVGLIDGEAEAYYGVLATNLLGTRITTDLERSENRTLLGALDLGGSSTQITVPHSNGAQEQQHTADRVGLRQKLSRDSFWMKSHLSYGVVTARERYFDALVGLAEKEEEDLDVDVHYISNPCGFQGQKLSHKGFLLLGTGDALQCIDGLTGAFGWDGMQGLSEITEGMPQIDYVEFYGMSVFYYALDCMRLYVGPDLEQTWPQPTLREILQSATRFCSLSWAGVVTTQHHQYTSEDELPHRCLEVNYIYALLHHGYGFPMHTRKITYALEVNGMDAEWTLGFALLQASVNMNERETETTMDTRNRELDGPCDQTHLAINALDLTGDKMPHKYNVEPLPSQQSSKHQLHGLGSYEDQNICTDTQQNSPQIGNQTSNASDFNFYLILLWNIKKEMNLVVSFIRNKIGAVIASLVTAIFLCCCFFSCTPSLCPHHNSTPFFSKGLWWWRYGKCIQHTELSQENSIGVPYS